MPAMSGAAVTTAPARPRRFREAAAGIAGMGLVAILLAAAIAAPRFSGGPSAQNLGLTLVAPGTAGHLCGTDSLGRDLCARTFVGVRVSLLVSVAAATIALVLGVPLGLASGYYGGPVDAMIMRLVDVQLAVPFVLLTLLVVAVLGPGIRNLVLVMGITGWVTYARVARGEALALREREYVSAARASGATDARILGRHVLPNMGATLLVVLTIDLARFVLLEGTMSFLGFGVQPPTPSLGALLNEGLNSIAVAWWPVMIPGLALTLLVLGINLWGDWLADRLTVSPVG
jgi:peptide/nickel transport system permease protein